MSAILNITTVISPIVRISPFCSRLQARRYSHHRQFREHYVQLLQSGNSRLYPQPIACISAQIKSFAALLVRSNFKVGPENVQFGVIVFQNYITAKIPLNEYESVEGVVSAIAQLPYDPGLTNTLT